MAERNWSGNYTYRARRIRRPATLEELQEIVSSAPRVRVLGSRHSFSDIADSDELVALDRLPGELVIDRDAGTASFGAALSYGAVAGQLTADGLALANLASLPHISVAGAVATATHGSGDGNGNLATAVAALELVTSDGELLTARRGEPDFAGQVVGLGALGAVTRITLDVEPAYEVRQRVFEGLAWESLYEHFDAIFAGGYSVSVFHRFRASVDQVWVKSRVGASPEAVHEGLFGARAATVDRHPIIGVDPVNCTAQLGVPGPWEQRLPHFRMGFTPSAGDEIQSEFLVARPHGVAAIDAVRSVAGAWATLVQVAEIRTVAGDELWLSTAHGQDMVALHFTWAREPAAVRAAVAAIERALEPFAARPHWGKVFLADAAALGPRYPRLADFCALRARLDPRGAFRNRWLDVHVLGSAAA